MSARSRRDGRGMVPTPWPRERVFVPGRPAIAAVHHAMPTRVAPHSHDFLELALVLDGEAVQRAIDGERALAGGDLVVLRPGAWHAYERCRGLDVYDCCVDAALLRAAGAWPARDGAFAALVERDAPRAAPTVVRLPGREVAMLRARLDELRDALAQRRPLAALGRLLLVLDAALGALPAPPRAPHPLAAAARAALEADLAAPWTLSALAARLRCDRSALVRRFRAQFGAPPMAWLARSRARRAADLLAATDWPVSRVAAAVGWRDAAHFAHRFRREHGEAATSWRRRHSGQ